MRNKFTKTAYAVAFGLSLSFAQEIPDELLPEEQPPEEQPVEDASQIAMDSNVVDKPHEPQVELADKKKSTVSFGIRAGLNFSHTYTEYASSTLGKSGKGSYGDILGKQAGFVVDFALNDWLHLQPGLIYIQKGMKDNEINIDAGIMTIIMGGSEITAHYLELPLLLSFKLDMLRLNAGPYLGLCPYSYDGYFGWFDKINYDIGLSTGIGVDIGMFYIGAFYDYGFANMNTRDSYKSYNRTLGFNVGINL